MPVLALDDDIRGLARIFVREKVMPGPLAGDAIHLAPACLHEVEYLLSWNVRHLANPNQAGACEEGVPEARGASTPDRHA